MAPGRRRPAQAPPRVGRRLRLDEVAEKGALVRDHAFDGFAEVVPYIPFVCAVLGLRGASAGAFGEERRAVAADDLDARVLA